MTSRLILASVCATVRARRLATLLAALLAVSLAATGCGTTASSDGSDGGADGGGVPLGEVPASTTPEPGVRRDVFVVDGVVPPANPVTKEATPASANKTQVLRYRQDADPPVGARAIIVAMPGLLGGGGSFDALARALVLRGKTAGQAIEVWAIDRRANLLEDLRGSNTAEAAGDPEIANDYYFNGLAVGCETFAGFLDQSKVSYMSEWGLATHVEDLRRVMALVGAADQKGHVFLLGHSLGGSFTEAFAAWRFDDGHAGYEQLAGLVLVDGVLGSAPSTQADYQNGSNAGGFGPQPGVDKIRSTTRYLAIPILGVDIYARAEVLALRALRHPSRVSVDEGRDTALRFLLSLNAQTLPKFTDLAAFAMGFDDSTCPLSFARCSLGASAGPMSTYMNLFGGDTISHPSNPALTYDWTDAPSAAPKEWTPVANLAHSFVDGRSNFPEWYFPMRLPLDLGAVGGARLDEAGWQATAGLRVFDGGKIDAPVLAISAALVPSAAFEAVRARIAPTVGAGRKSAGANRMTDAGFKVVTTSAMTHLDPLTASDRADNPVPAAVAAFVLANAADGTIAIPVK